MASSSTLNLLALLVPLLAAGCASVQPKVLPPLAAAAELEAVEEPDLLARADAARRQILPDPERALREEIEALEEAHRRAEAEERDEAALLVRLARSGLELGVLLEGEQAEKDEVRAVYERSLSHAYEALLENEAFAGAIGPEGAIEDAARAALRPEDAEAALVCASSWGAVSRLRGPFSFLRDRSKILALAERALELDPACAGAGPDRFFGVYWALLPGFLGGDLERSRRHFESARALAPDYAWNEVLLAETWALKAGEEEEARRLLERVIALTPDESDPQYADQVLAQLRARAVLRRLTPPGEETGTRARLGPERTALGDT